MKIVCRLRGARKTLKTQRELSFSLTNEAIFFLFFVFLFLAILFIHLEGWNALVRCFWVDAILLDEVWNSGNNPTNDDLNLYTITRRQLRMMEQHEKKKTEEERVGLGRRSIINREMRYALKFFIICKYISQEER
jgi:hypothetical protein